MAHGVLDRRVLFRACLALAITSAIAVPARAGRQKVILDQDAFGPAGSDLQSLLMVIQDPRFEVLGITVVTGDGWAKEEAVHTLRMLELIGRPDIPVALGGTRPLVNSEEETKRWETLYGHMGYKGAWTPTGPAANAFDHPVYHAADVVPPLAEGEPTLHPLAEPAPVFIARKVREFPHQVMLLAMGPFTNLALAGALDEAVPGLAQGLVLMGGQFDPGSIRVDGEVHEYLTGAKSEFNFRFDPEAGHMVLHAGWKSIVVIPTDATIGTHYTPALHARVTAGAGTPAARYLAHYARLGMPMWDEVAAAVLIDPTIVRQSVPLAMDIDIAHGPNYGATLSWTPKRAPGLGEPVVTVVRTVDIPRLEAMLVAAVQRPPQAP